MSGLKMVQHSVETSCRPSGTRVPPSGMTEWSKRTPCKFEDKRGGELLTIRAGEKHLRVLTTWERKVQEIREDFQEVSMSSALGDHIRTFP